MDRRPLRVEGSCGAPCIKERREWIILTLWPPSLFLLFFLPSPFPCYFSPYDSSAFLSVLLHSFLFSSLLPFIPLSLSPIFLHPPNLPPSLTLSLHPSHTSLSSFQFLVFLFLLSSLSSSFSFLLLPSRYPASFAIYTLVKELCFLAMIVATMGHQHKIFGQILKLICSTLLNKTLEQAFSYNSVLKN